MKKTLTKHHIIPKSVGGNNHYNNILPLGQTPHRALHVLFRNEHPVEQIQTIIDMTGKAFNNAFILDIEEVLGNSTLEEIYNEKCYIKNILLNK